MDGMTRREWLGSVAGLALLGSRRSAAAGQDPDFRTALEALRQKNDVPALACVVLHRGQQVALEATGVRKLGDPTPVTTADRFHLGSCTKSMTATLAGMMIENGKLDWSTPLAEALPKMAPRMHADLKAVTVEQLMAHRSGMTQHNSPKVDSLFNLLQAGKLGETPREQRRAFVDLILQEPPDSAPGTKYLYSNRNFVTLGVAVEEAADTSWEDLIAARLFKPLGIMTGGFGAMGMAGKVDQPWQHQGRKPIEPGPLADNPSVIGPAGTVHLSAGDWGRYLQAHQGGEAGKSALLKPETFKRLHSGPFGGNYGGGWILGHRGSRELGRSIWHNGSNNQNFALAIVSLDVEFAAGAMCNSGGGAKACDDALAEAIRRFIRR